MASFEKAILDMTDPWIGSGEGESLERALEAIAVSLERRVELLAKSVSHSASATTEQGIVHVAYVNGTITGQGEMARAISCDDFSVPAQVRAMQEASDSTYDCILANKPPEADLLIWRIRPEASRCLKPEGLDVKIYTRLAWDKLRADA